MAQRRACPQVALRGWPGGEATGARRWAPVLGQARAAGLLGRHRARRAPPRSCDDGGRRRALEHDPRVIVEAHAPGLEVECSVLGDTEPALASRARSSAHRRRLVRLRGEVRAGRDGARRAGADLRDRAASACGARRRARSRLAGCSGLARVDFFVDGDDVLLNELNTMPGFTQTSVYGKLWAASGLPYPELVDRLVRARGRALRRASARRSSAGR